MNGHKFLSITVLLFSITFIVSCSLAPTYHRPRLNIPLSYKENGKWLLAKPKGNLNRGPWWEMYNDKKLNELEEQILFANQDLQSAVARYEQARAAVMVARSALYPNLLGVVNANRQGTSKTIANPLSATTFNDFLISADLTYEVDVWGRIRNLIKEAKSLACASADDLATLDLSLHTELAIDYFALRSADDSQQVLDETVEAYQSALYLTRQRFKGGAVSVLDVDQAQTQLETAKTQAADNRLKREQFEHAIAILIGRPPAAFNLPPSRYYHITQVTIDPYLPSSLLERRPDIASKEQLVQAANAHIGVARAAFFPAINLTTGIGYESQTLSHLLTAPSLIWSLGPSALLTIFNSNGSPLVSQTIFDGGRLLGLDKAAWANYCETVANYRQTVLIAFQEVEDNLTALRQLDVENKTQGAATKAANRALQQALFQYKGGLTTYLDVVVVQTTALKNELNLVDVRTRRQIASIQLIKALGGGWR
jgi:NodT family efflux transporter outer membrane factor (OMF) lipoprotein